MRMLENYARTAVRAHQKHVSNFLLNVAGLTIGLTATLLVMIYVVYELSFDRFQPDASSTFRLAQVHKDAGELRESLIAETSASLAVKQITEKMPEVEAIFALYPMAGAGGIVVSINGQQYTLNGLFAATPNLREFVQINVVDGDIDAALKAPYRIAVSRSEAVRLFGKADVVGETIVTQRGRLAVTAVFDDLPSNTHYSFRSLTFANPNRNADQFWGQTYVKLGRNIDQAALTEKIRTQINARSLQPWQIGLMPLTDIHIKSGNNQRTINICLALSVLLLTIASFNFVNISTAQAARRAKEVGVRKALGASRQQLVVQFLVEAIVIVAVGAAVAALFVLLLLPWFSELVNAPLSRDRIVPMLAWMVVFVLTVGVLSGLYPALFISSFSARRVLSGDLNRGRTAVIVRKVLLVIQTIFAVCLVISTVVVLRQISHLSDLSVGYAKSQRMEVRGLPTRKTFDPKNSVVVAELERIRGVMSATPFDRTLTEGPGSMMNIVYPRSPDQRPGVAFTATGFNVVPTVGLQLVAGRDFSSQFSADWYHKDETGVERASVLITESMSRAAGYSAPQEALGQAFKLGIDRQKTDFYVTVVGVVRDVKVGSNRETLPYPLFFICGYSWSPTSTFVLHVDETINPQARGEVAKVIRKHFGVSNPDIRLVEENYRSIYQYEQRQAELVLTFSILAVFLTCVGLFGLAAFSTERRNKEVAIRKVLGASRQSLVGLLTKEYVVLVAGSALIACPVAFVLTGDWLSNFNDRVNQSTIVYLGASVLILGLAWLTVASLALRVSSARPAAVLRYD